MTSALDDLLVTIDSLELHEFLKNELKAKAQEVYEDGYADGAVDSTKHG